MCIFKDKWPKPPTPDEYLTEWKIYNKAIQEITTLQQLKDFIKPFTYKSDIKDHWQKPHETYFKGTFDCEDMAIMVMDILKRILGVTDVNFIIYGGYFMKEGKRTYSAHAVCIFYYKHPARTQESYYEFTNKILRHAFYKDQGNFIEYGYRHYPEGLKSYERRDYTGKIIEKKRKWIGYLE